MGEMPKYIGCDVFCGVGGMSLGFEQAGFEIIFAVDYDPVHIDTYSLNFPNRKAICADVLKLSSDKILELALLGNRRLDVLFGGPPCEGFSIIGKRDSNDPRNLLINHFARLVAELNPKYFVLENVQGLLLGNARNVVADFLIAVRRAGYSVVLPIQTLDASDFGVPQRRARVFLLGYKKGLCAPEYPKPRDYINGNHSLPSVWDAIGDLPDIDDIEELLRSDAYCGELGVPTDYARVLRCEETDSEDLSDYSLNKTGCLTGCSRTIHSKETVQRFNATVPGSYERVSSYYRLTKYGLANTLRSGSDKDHGSYTAPRPIHPVHPRCITIREAARLHSFPDWFQFHPTKWHGFRQVGNSVPPYLARAVARSVAEALVKE